MASALMPFAAPPAALAALEEMYVFRQRSQVVAFLEKHADLIPLLTDAYTQIGSFFPNSPAFLHIEDGAGKGKTQIVVCIAANFAPHEIDLRMDAFCERWWHDAKEKAHGRLRVNVGC